MKLIHSGIHKKIGFLIQHIGGYDQEYHITTLANKFNINREDINVLFKESSRSNLYQYIELLENGMNVEKVFELMENDNKIIRRKLNTTMAIMGGIVANSPYRNML